MSAIPSRRKRLLTERMLTLVPTPEMGSDVYQNAETLWHPLWARGIFGGAIIAQSLTAAQKTTPTGFFLHSMHCHFIQPAQTYTPVSYHVHRTRDGRSLATRLVHVRQSGKHIFSATLSFARETPPHGSSTGGPKALHHQAAVPVRALASGPPTLPGQPIDPRRLTRTGQADTGSLYECVRIPRDGKTEGRPESIRLLHWIRVRGEEATTTSPSPPLGNEDDINAHLAALAYVSDHYFIGTALRVNNGERFASSTSSYSMMQSFDTDTTEGREKLNLFQELIREEQEENRQVKAAKPTASVEPTVTAEFMVSLDHTIYIHEPTAVRADEWMIVEAEATWTGHERALVMERIWNSSGVHIATCVQEGMIRVKQDSPQSKF